jgi:hypothetical protein
MTLTVDYSADIIRDGQSNDARIAFSRGTRLETLASQLTGHPSGLGEIVVQTGPVSGRGSESDDPAPSDADTLQRHVRDALLHLYDLSYLQKHPLTTRLGLAGRPQRSSVGLSLQQFLVDAVESLQPSRLNPTSRAARGHRLLVARYVDARQVMEVCEILGIGQSEYYREHNRALQALTSVLESRLAPHADLPRRSGVSFVSSDQVVPEPGEPQVNARPELPTTISAAAEPAQVMPPTEAILVHTPQPSTRSASGAATLLTATASRAPLGPTLTQNPGIPAPPVSISGRFRQLVRAHRVAEVFGDVTFNRGLLRYTFIQGDGAPLAFIWAIGLAIFTIVLPSAALVVAWTAVIAAITLGMLRGYGRDWKVRAEVLRAVMIDRYRIGGGTSNVMPRDVVASQRRAVDLAAEIAARLNLWSAGQPGSVLHRDLPDLDAMLRLQRSSAEQVGELQRVLAIISQGEDRLSRDEHTDRMRQENVVAVERALNDARGLVDAVSARLEVLLLQVAQMDQRAIDMADARQFAPNLRQALERLQMQVAAQRLAADELLELLVPGNSVADD